MLNNNIYRILLFHEIDLKIIENDAYCSKMKNIHFLFNNKLNKYISFIITDL
jgi:hypothetical protein